MIAEVESEERNIRTGNFSDQENSLRYKMKLKGQGQKVAAAILDSVYNLAQV